MRIGVYVCHCGGNISEVVDVEEVRSFAGKQPGVVVARNYEHMCSELGQKLVVDDIKEYKLDRVVIGSCSPQFHEPTFQKTLSGAGLNPYLLEMANIREHCSWPHFDKPEAATAKAKDLVNMAIAKVRLNDPLEREAMPVGNRVLVIGGGVAGIQSALDLGDAGFKVHLVEEAPTVGGRMAQLSRTFPTEDCAACILAPKMADVAANPNITLLTYTEIENIEGYLGNFKVTVKKKPRYINLDKCTNCGICTTKCPVKVPDEYNVGLTTRKAIYVPHDFAVPLKYLIDEKACLYLTKGVCRICEKVCPGKAIEFNQKPEEIKFRADTIVVATGYDPFDAEKKEEYGYGRYENVVTALQMERMVVFMAGGRPLRDLGKRIAFIQCVGSRDAQIGNEYCSRVCCMYAAKLSQMLKRGNPERDIYVFCTDIRAYGKGFEEYYKRAQATGVKYVRGRVAEVSEDPKTKKLTLRVEDIFSRQLLELEFDTVVLSIGMVPSNGTSKIADMLKLARSPDGFLLEAHPKFKPLDTLIGGVFICGCAQGPKDIPDTVAQASGAASRATVLMNKGEVDLDPVKAFVIEDLCDSCGLCVEHCPVHAIKVSSVANVNKALCAGCGSCTTYCPKGALVLRHYTGDQLLAEVKAVLASKNEGETRILVFADYTCTYKLSDSVGTSRMPYADDVRIIRVPSGSAITPKLMLSAFALGADGVFIGECEQKFSPYPNAVEQIEKNVSTVRGILEKNGIEPERARSTVFATVMLGGFVNQLNALSKFVKEASSIPPEKRGALDEVLQQEGST